MQIALCLIGGLIILGIVIIATWSVAKSKYQGVPIIEEDGKVNVDVTADYNVLEYTKLKSGRFLVKTERRGDRRQTFFELEKEPTTKMFRVDVMKNGEITYLRGMM